jgi:2-methylcitrate dehydratase
MTVVDEIYECALGIMRNKLSDADSEEIKKRIIDSIFVAYSAKDSEPVKIIKSALLPAKGKREAPIYFSKRSAAVDTATFINGSMTRYMDYNDTYLSKEALHPSDNIPPILAMSSSLELDGASAIKAIAVAYQVVCALSDSVSIRDRGWDHVTYVSISSAAGLASLMGLDAQKFAHTLNLAINNNISLRQTRAGELSMWKGLTAADASRNSVFAALLAEKGLTGPAPIFEGEMGFFKQVSGGFKLDLKTDRIVKTMIKNYPVEYHAMSGVEAALKLKEKLSGRIEKIDVETFSVANKIIVKDPEKLRPKTKETADHSLPYIIAYTILNGAPTPNSYSDKHLADKKILGLMDRMSFNVSQRFDSMYPEYLPIKITVSTDSSRFEEEVTVPKGHFRNPYSWDDLRNKGIAIINDDSVVDSLIMVGKDLDKKSVSELFEVVSSVDS